MIKWMFNLNYISICSCIIAIEKGSCHYLTKSIDSFIVIKNYGTEYDRFWRCRG